MAMPEQRLDRSPDAPPMGHAYAGRRAFVFGAAILMTLVGAYEMNAVLNGRGASVLGVTLLLLFVSLFAWIALAFTSALGGVIARFGRPAIDVTGPLPTLTTRTALLMPTYNEDPGRVMAGVQAMQESLDATGQGAQFDVFILSDTTQPDIWIAEEAALLALEGPVYYRRRPKNTARKAGNIAEWVTRFGAAYPQMLTWDADSLMEGETIVRIVAAMERHPGVALIQTLPVIVNGTTLFARMQQFAGRVYGPLIAQGITWWHGPEGNYWGHNAVIRTRAFAEQAGLPLLPGRAPFGGHILSHDFVEAALMRRAGWAIHMVPGLGGSYEESPPSLTDIAVRDRRWAQGNLQHAGVVRARGLHWVSRMHLLMGIGSYVTSPLWLIFLVLGVLTALQARFVRPEYFGPGRSLFPNWPSVDPVLAMQVFIATMAVLLLPKLLAYALMLFDAPLRRGCGGAVRAGLSVLIETLLGGLIAPVAMLIQSMAVLGILLGRDSGWNAQRRDGDRVRVTDVARAYGRYTLFGLVLAAAAYAVSPSLFAWMTPVLLGLSLAIPLVALTSGPVPLLRRLGLLLIPEERHPPPILARAAQLRAGLDGAPIGPAIPRLLSDPALMAAHRAMLPPPRPRGVGTLDPALLMGLAKLAEHDRLADVLPTLTPAETAALLGNAEGLDRLETLS